MTEFKRGDIFYIDKLDTEGFSQSVGSEQQPGRPALIVSNDKCNQYSDVIEVVYLTSQPKKNLPTHVVINGLQRKSTALCEQVHSISKSRFQKYMDAASAAEMDEINAALIISLGLNSVSSEPPEVSKSVSAPSPTQSLRYPGDSWASRFQQEKEKNEVISNMLMKAQEEIGACRTYRELYVDILDRIWANHVFASKQKGKTK